MTTNKAVELHVKAEADDDAPCQPILWRVLIKPLPPREKTAGGIVLSETLRDAEQQMTCVGQVTRMGGLAFAAETKAGLKLANEPNKPRTGSWVIVHQYAGQKIWAGDTEYRIVSDTEILAVTENPEDLRNYV